MSYKINEIEGIGPAFGEKLVAAGIKTTDDLLAKCGSPDGRKSMADATGIASKQLLTWANMADLMRISGVGKQFAELLVCAGVDTVKELQHRKAENLAAKIKEINDEKHLAKSSPSDSQVQQWVTQAGSITPAITH